MSDANPANPPGIEIEPRIMRFGLKQIMMRSGDMVLCVASPVSLRLISVSGLRMLTSWEYPLIGPISPRFFVIPRLGSHVLSSMVGQELTRLTLNSVGAQTILGMEDRRGQYE